MTLADVRTSGGLFNDVPLQLVGGEALSNVEVAFSITGDLDNPRGIVFIAHALTGDQFVCSTASRAGWWDRYVGRGKAIDTDRYCVVCTNVLAGCMGTTGPSNIDERDGRRWGRRFPVITIEDMVRVQREFLRNIGVDEVHAVVGGSMGGMQVLEWLRLFPEISHRYVVIAASYRQPVQNIGFHEIGRRAIMLDPDWQGGDYYGADTSGESEGPQSGLSIARMIGHMTYMSPHSLSDKFGRRLNSRNQKSFELEDDFQIESYLGYQGGSFTTRFDANSYLYLTKAVDYFDQSEEFAWDLVDAYASIDGIRGKVVDLVSFDSDWLYPPSEMATIYNAVQHVGGRATHQTIPSVGGHDSFLLENAKFDRVLRSLIV